MTEVIIPATLINKLGHNILEIRERALLTLLSKIDNGFLFENNLSQSKEMLSKLLEWFLHSPCPHEEMVLALIKRILLTKSGSTLINHYGPDTIEKELRKVEECIEPRFHNSVQEIVDIVHAFKENNVEIEETVPKLNSEIPLSYRSGQSFESSNNKTRIFEGFISKSPSVEQEQPASGRITENAETYRVNSPTFPLGSDNFEEVLPNFTCQWQPLIETDKLVISSVEKSLKNTSNPAELLHSCEFFSDVILHDFPAEIFLQRPEIVGMLRDLLLNCSSTRVAGAVLNCLINLTQNLTKRIDQCNDPCLRCLKNYCKIISSQNFGDLTPSSSKEITEFEENVEVLIERQLPTPHYCLILLNSVFEYLIIKPESLHFTRKKHENLHRAAVLVENLLKLLKRTLNFEIFNVQAHGIVYETLKFLNEAFHSLGELLDNYRIEVNTDVRNVKFRAIYLCLLHHCSYFLKEFIPMSRAAYFLPKNFKNALTSTLLDVSLSKLYPDIYENALEYAQTFNNNSSKLFEKFKSVREMCKSLSAAVKFMRNFDTLNFPALMKLGNEAIPSLQFHRNLEFIDEIVEVCATKFSFRTYENDTVQSMENLILKLFSHNLSEVVERAYEVSYKKVVSAIGPSLNLTGKGVSCAQVSFLLRTKIFVRIATFGLINADGKIVKYSEDILIHILKCKILVTEEMWDKVVLALIPALPILLLFTSKLSSIGRTLINVIDPDIAKDLRISNLDVFKFNVLLLFSPEDLVRDEAFSRICWLLALQENSKNLLPRLNNVNDKTLPNVFSSSAKSFDINKSRSSERFYQPTSLQHVMELLDSQNVEPGIRRSALTQIGVMLEDYLLHEIFIDKNGVEIILNIMSSSLNEEDYQNYPDSIIPCVAILKNVCIFSAKIRNELSRNLNLFQSVLRGAFLFFTEERMRIDSSTLLFLTIFSGYIEGTPSRGNMSIPKIISDKIATPITCGFHDEFGKFRSEDSTRIFEGEKSCLCSLRIHWNAEIHGGFEKLAQLPKIRDPHDLVTPEMLRISEKDLNQIKVSCVDYSISECLSEMRRGENNARTEEIVVALQIYVYLQTLAKPAEPNLILNHKWEDSFANFLRILPSSEEDASLLFAVMNFLKNLVKFYKISERKCWITNILKDPTHYVTDLMSIDNSTDEHLRFLSKSLVELVTECVAQEQHFVDFYILKSDVNLSIEWANIIENVTNNLKFQNPQQMYNLAYLDAILKCLVRLSTMLGWSNFKRKSSPKQTMRQLISGLCDLVDAFHYGKGPIAAVSLMGLSITKNVLLILNHIIAEMVHSNIKNWDLLFVEEISEENKILNFVMLWDTRDVILRAAVLQFFSGLVKSSRLARDIVMELKSKKKCLWRMSLGILFDGEEASIVRENAALILANLFTHKTLPSNILHEELTPLECDKNDRSSISKILEILEENKSVAQLKTLMLCLYTYNLSGNDKDLNLNKKSSDFLYTYRGGDISERSWTSRNNVELNIATPSLIKTILIFLHNLIEMTDQSFVDNLNESGLIKLIFRSICVPSIELKNTRNLSLYVELLEMDCEVCFFLNKTVKMSPGCLGTLLHTKDCLNVLLSLLDGRIYHVHLPQLFYLRNKLWSEIFSLINAFLECGCRVENPKRAFEILDIILDSIFDYGPTYFVGAICEALSTFGGNDSQSTVLLTMILMIQIECSYNELGESGKHSIQTLFDTVVPPKCENLNVEMLKNDKVSEDVIEKYKMNLLEKIYYTESFERNNADRSSSDEEEKRKGQREPRSSGEKRLAAGAEICKLLLNLYEIYDFKAGKESSQKQVVLGATSSVLCVSNEAKYFALDSGFLERIISSLRDLSNKLSLENVDCFRRPADRKRLSPLLTDLDSLIGLVTNFLLGNLSVKCEASCLGLADIVHKVWGWLRLHKTSLVNALKMLATFTTNCPIACQSLPYTSPIAGTGPRKNTSSTSLLFEIVSKISREMEMLSKTHDMFPLKLCFNILKNCSPVAECRNCIAKSSLLQDMLKIHPAITKRQKPWEIIELIWLEFLEIFTVYPEGQMYVGKVPDVLDLIITLAKSNREKNKEAALIILQNTSFYTPNRARLLTTPNFIKTLSSKLESGSSKEKIVVVNIIWALAANNVKAKTVFKSAKLDVLLGEALKKIQLLDDTLSEDEVDRMKYVLDILRDKNGN